MPLSRLGSGFLTALAAAATARAGGAWVPEPGRGDMQLGWSQKTAHTSWNVNGDLFTNRSGGEITYPDFRYLYLSGRGGHLPQRVRRFLLTYLNGVEGPTDDEYVNRGLSDSWFGVRYQVHGGRVPMAVGVTYRTAALYDQPGAYNRFLFDSQGEIRGNNPEWRGVLKSDWTVSYQAGRAPSRRADGRTWISGTRGGKERRGTRSRSRWKSVIRSPGSERRPRRPASTYGAATTTRLVSPMTASGRTRRSASTRPAWVAWASVSSFPSTEGAPGPQRLATTPGSGDAPRGATASRTSRSAGF